MTYVWIALLALVAAALGGWIGARFALRPLRDLQNYDPLVGALYSGEPEAVDEPRQIDTGTEAHARQTVPSAPHQQAGGFDPLQFDALDGIFGSIRALSDQVAHAQQGEQNLALFHEFMRLEAITSMAAPLFDAGLSELLRRNLDTIREFLADPGVWDVDYRKGFMEALYRLHADLRAYIAPMLPSNVDNIVGFLRSHVSAELGAERPYDEAEEFYRGN